MEKACVQCGKIFSRQKVDESICFACTPLVEGVDYYFENGLMVFTEAYHLRRGHCCDSGCRHCPYGKAD